MKYVSLALMVIGALVMMVAIKKYYEMVMTAREEEYPSQTSSARVGVFSLILMFIFLGGFVVGLVDVITRNVEPIYLFVTLIFFLGAIFIYSTINAEHIMLIQLREKTMEIMKTFVNSIEMKDEYTRGHSQHVYYITAVFYDHLKAEDKDRTNRTRLLDAALLHDIGKISISDEILKNPEKITGGEDSEQIKKHPLNGKKILDDTCFSVISDWVLYHHERMDGKGYYNLPGEKIPFESRIIAIADTYSALRTDRVYREKKTHKEVIKIMQGEAGRQFDTDLLECFCKIDSEELSNLR